MTDVAVLAPAEPAQSALRTAGARGVLWTGGQALFARILSLVGFVVLGRILGPDEFGLAALANVFVTLLATFAAAGVTPTLVQKAELEEGEADSAFWAGIALSVLLAAALVLAAWPLASAFDEPVLRPMLQALAACFVFTALGGVPMALLQRRMAFGVIAGAAATANVVATVVGIGVAVAGGGAWSLVVQTLLGVGLTTSICFWRSGYRPQRRVHRSQVREVLGTGSHFAGTSLADLLCQRTGDFAVGAVLGTTLLGVYAVANRVLVVLVEVLSISIRNVAFPVFARVQHDRDALERAYLSAQRLAATVSAPVFLLALALAPEVVLGAFGDAWEPSIRIMQILCLFGPLNAVMQFNATVLQAVGRSKVVLQLTLFSAALQVVALMAFARHGLVWVAVVFVARAYLLAPFELRLATRQVGIPLRRPLLELLPPAVSGAALVGAIELARLGPVGRFALWPRLVVLAAVGVTAFGLVLAITGRRHLVDVVDTLRTTVRR